MEAPLADQHAAPEIAASFPDRGEAEVAKALLEANGIHAAVIDDVEGGTVPVDGEPGVRVMVPAADVAAARSLLGSE